MAGVTGKDWRVFVSSDGTSGGTKTELECQGDLTINTGKTTNRTRAKNCVHAYTSDDGYGVEASFLEELPLGTAQALLWTSHDAEDARHYWFENTNATGMSFAGSFRVVVTQIGAPEDGVATHSVTWTQDGAVTRGAVSA